MCTGVSRFYLFEEKKSKFPRKTLFINIVHKNIILTINTHQNVLKPKYVVNRLLTPLWVTFLFKNILYSFFRLLRRLVASSADLLVSIKFSSQTFFANYCLKSKFARVAWEKRFLSLAELISFGIFTRA